MSQDRPPTRGLPRMRGYGYIDPAAIGVPTIEIFCQEESHAETRFDFPTFGKCEGEWIPLPPTMQAKRLRSRDDFMAAIDTATGLRVRLPADTALDLSYNFKCGECGLTVPASGKSLHPIFDVLHGAGVSSVSLSALSARLRSGMPR